MPRSKRSNYSGIYTIEILPVGYVRLTQSDKWRGMRKGSKPMRPAVARYFAYRDELRLKARLAGLEVRAPYLLEFYLPFPKTQGKRSWELERPIPHTSKPDKDNLEKAFLDALVPNDQVVWGGLVFKWCSHFPGIVYTQLSTAFISDLRARACHEAGRLAAIEEFSLAGK